jgi:CRISPR-associated helicase Cas3/CRISPR-associated endonuclease Cas3-HD
LKPPIQGFWGKAKQDRITGDISAWLPLVDHCLDVALVFRSLTRLPLIRRRLEAAADTRLEEVQLDRLAVIALLHDLGKLNLGFQDKILRKDAPRAGHVKELAPLFFESKLNEQLAAVLNLDTLIHWFHTSSTLESFLVASVSHHGSPVLFEESDKTGNYHPAKTRWWCPDGTRDPFKGITELITTAQRAFPQAFSPGGFLIPDAPALQHRFAGLVMLADWLGSHEGFFPYDRDVGDRLVFGSKAALQSLETVGLDVRKPQSDLAARRPGFKDLFGFIPRPLQATLAALPASDETNRLLIAEAETGSGKTEAALARFFALFSAGEVDGLYFALPTRVAARELYGRVLRYTERAFPNPDTRPPVLLAVPGYARLDGVEARKFLPSPEVRWDDDTCQQWQERAWAAERPKRFLAATIVVGTVDQALLSALQTRHAHLRSVCLDRHLLVVDEVHASDPYMRRLLRGLLDHHLSLGGHALLLSATLGAVARAEFLAQSGGRIEPPNFATACTAPYPSLTNRQGQQDVVARNGEAVPEKHVRVELLPTLSQPEGLLPEIARALKAKGRVLVVLNTVSRAISLQRAVETHPEIPPAALFRCGEVITPHHGRFAPVDREQLDAAVSARFGKGSALGPVLLIGTQTLEQSLDIDTDLLITDLCPMDVLLQRIGRLHRHHRERPAGFERAQCYVLTHTDPTLESLLRPDGKVTGVAGLGSVYADLRVLRLTRDLLAETPEIVIPRDNRRLVEGATHPERLASLAGERWRRHGENVEGAHLAQEIRAHYAALADLYKQPFGIFTFNELSAEARTRLGLDDLRVHLHEDLPEDLLSPFGQPLKELVIPGHLAPGDKMEDRVTPEDVSPEMIRFRLGLYCYRYSRLGLERLDEPAA